MPPQTAAAARRRHHGAPARRAAAPRHPRRVSGPVARAVPAVATPGAGALPRRRTDAFERLRALPAHRLVDRLLRGRVWIWLIGIMLGGIVAMQVSLLKLNSGISQSVERSGVLERQNADLEAGLAQLASGERIAAVATKEAMMTPAAGAIDYLTARPGQDARLAVERMQPASDEARQVMANGGWAPAPAGTTAPASGIVAPATTTPAAPATATTPPATAPPAVVPASPPVQAASPPTTAATGTGAATAPQG